MHKLKIGLFVFSLFCSLVLINSALAHSQTQVIEITAEGFTPSAVTVDTNSTIFFLNKDKGSHWPASNPHPTHDLYPEFDPQMPIENGKSWTFKPKKTGEWKYHDHLNPHKGGILKVIAENTTEVPSENPESSWVEKLKDYIASFWTMLKNALGSKVVLASDKFVKQSPSEQFDQLKQYADSQGAEKAWQFIKETFKGQAGSSGNIHDLAHLAGGLLFEKNGFANLGECSAEFAFGCFHGFLDKAFAKSLDHLDDAEDACLKLGPNLSGPAASCIHGIGHGVASFYQVRNLQKSLLSCRKLISGKEYCFDGVFMEYMRSAADNFYQQDDPLYPCDQLEKKYGYAYSFSCGRNQPTVLMSRFKMGFDEVVKTCLASDSRPFKEACMTALGFSIAASADPEQIITSCQKIGEEEYVRHCTKSAAGELIFQEVPGWKEKSAAVCQSLENSQECFEYIQRLIEDYHR